MKRMSARRTRITNRFLGFAYRCIGFGQRSKAPVAPPHTERQLADPAHGQARAAI